MGNNLRYEIVPDNPPLLLGFFQQEKPGLAVCKRADDVYDSFTLEVTRAVDTSDG
jgi:hypothetical protein